jgi:hypothetical protein
MTHASERGAVHEKKYDHSSRIVSLQSAVAECSFCCQFQKRNQKPNPMRDAILAL